MSDKTLEQLVAEVQEHGALLRETASAMNVLEFSELVKAEIRLWGNPPAYACVRFGEVDYLWRLSDGGFDGWDVNIRREQ